MMSSFKCNSKNQQTIDTTIFPIILRLKYIISPFSLSSLTTQRPNPLFGASDLDSFTRLYRYYVEAGYWAIVVSKLASLLYGVWVMFMGVLVVLLVDFILFVLLGLSTI